MRTSAVVIAALVAVGGCKNGGSGRWREERAATIELAGYVATIPQGWRSVDEVADDELRAKVQPQADVKALVAEDFRVGDPNILFATTPLEGSEIDDAGCRALADPGPAGGLVTDVQRATFDGEPGCTWNFVVSNQSGTAQARFNGTDVLLTECTWSGKATQQFRDICAETMASIKRR